MAGETKVILSNDELELVSDTRWHLAKQEILKKIEMMLAELPPGIDKVMKDVLMAQNPSGAQYNSETQHYAETQAIASLLVSIPKISKGDNYKGLPYLILDYPRFFQKENIFALRTMFWWGRQLSVTLHLSGSYHELFSNKIMQKLPAGTGLYIATGDDEWDHDINGGGYAKLTGAEQLVNRKFNKIAAACDVSRLNEAPAFFKESYKMIAGMLY